jgi:hypothetical protein
MESEKSSDDSNGEDASLDFRDRNDDGAAGDVIEDDKAAGSYNELAKGLGLDGHTSSPSSDSQAMQQTRVQVLGTVCKAKPPMTMPT